MELSILNKSDNIQETNETPKNDEFHQPQLSEVAVALCINGISQTVMMVSPNNLHDFAMGFALSEGLIHSIEEVQEIVIESTPLGYEIDIKVFARVEYRLKARRRTMAGPSGCGLCGIESINEAMALPTKNTSKTVLPPTNVIIKARNSLTQIQKEHNGIKGNHCAVYFDLLANAISVTEDVGRHSALDKLIGCMYKNNQITTPGFALLTSRCSHDLVIKTVRANIPVLVTLAQPTDLAVASAKQTGLVLFCFQHQTLKRFA